MMRLTNMVQYWVMEKVTASHMMRLTNMVQYCVMEKVTASHALFQHTRRSPRLQAIDLLSAIWPRSSLFVPSHKISDTFLALLHEQSRAR